MTGRKGITQGLSVGWSNPSSLTSTRWVVEPNQIAGRGEVEGEWMKRVMEQE